MNMVPRASKERRFALYAVILLAGAIFGAVGSMVLAQAGASDEPIVQEELTRQTVESAEGPQTVWVRRVELAPEAAMAPEPEIEHPAEEFVYVLDGTATLTRQGAEPLEFAPGEAWHNDFERPHTLENASTTEPLALIAVWIGDEGEF